MMVSGSRHTDIRLNHWVFRFTPQSLWPYLSLMRLDRAIGTWLLLLPAWWAMALSLSGLSGITLHHFFVFLLFGLGAIIMRGAGCVINDIWDRDIDQSVERTRNRPLASGQVSIAQAISFAIFLLVIGFLILIQFSFVAICLGLLSLILVILYPLAKRVTWYPQAVLGLTFNFGVLIGSAAVLGSVPGVMILLYSASFFWTMGYDTIYAHQDIVDDGIVGIKSTARKFGEQSRLFVSLFYMIVAGFIYLTGVVTGAGICFYILWMLASFHLLWQAAQIKFNDPEDCLNKFRSNRDFAFLVFAAYLFGYIDII